MAVVMPLAPAKSWRSSRGGESVAGGCHCVARGFQEFAGFTHAAVHCLGAEAEQGGDGDLGQGEAMVQGDGNEPVGQGEYRVAPGAVPGLTRRGRCPRRSSSAVSCCCSWRVIGVLTSVSHADCGTSVRAGWHSQARSQS